MIITVLSDTHQDYPDIMLEHIFSTYCSTADMVLHCGDMVSESVWAFFNAHPHFFAVQGNCDMEPLRGSLPMLREVNADKVRIGMGHGWGPRSQVGQAVASQFVDVDIVCYGHTHIRDWHQDTHGVWLLNPGSVFWPRDGQRGLAQLRLEAGQPPTVEWITLP